MERTKDDYLQLILGRIRKNEMGSSNMEIDPETYERLNEITSISEKILRQMFTGTYSSSVQIGTLTRLCKALGKESFQELVDEVAAEEGEIVDLIVTDKKVSDWLEREASVLGRASLKFNEENYGISQPLVVPLQFASDQKFWKNWAFSSAVMNEPIKIQKINSRFRLHIGIHDQLLAIYNNAGKKFLNQTYFSEEKWNKDEERSEELNNFLNGKSEKNEHTIDFNPLRWASGGVLPIVTFKHPNHIKPTEWVLMFYRDLNPVAWTIPLGCSHDSEEMSNLTRLLFREFSEEILLIDRQPSEKHVFQKRFFHSERENNDFISREFTKTQRKLRYEHDGLTIALASDGEDIQMFSGKSKMEVSVNGAFTRNVSISVNPKEMGIEVVKVIEFDIGENDYILDGEFSENENPFLIRRPPMLVSMDFIKNQIERTGQIGEEYLGEDSTLRDCRVLRNLSEHDYHLFDYEIKLREQRLEYLRANPEENFKELSFHENWIKNHENKFSHDSISNGILLAPVVWKALENTY